MLKVRIIPTLLYKDHGLVKGVGFDSWRRVGTALPTIKVYSMREVDELILMDIGATLESRTIDRDIVDELADECFMPLTVGGGVRSVADFQTLLRAGADKVAINSAALDDPDLITRAAASTGSQCVVVSIDVRRAADGRREVWTKSGTRPTGMDAVTWARRTEALGAGEILLTSIDEDGSMHGYDYDIISAVCNAVSIPVIASGGAGDFEHMRHAIQECGASAVAAASIFHFTEKTPREAKAHLGAHGVPVRV